MPGPTRHPPPGPRTYPPPPKHVPQTADRDWGSPHHWTDFHRHAITPPPARFVVYTKLTAPLTGVGNRTIPAGSYMTEASRLATEAIGEPTDDPRKVQMRAWLRKYWKAAYADAIGTYDDAWFFSHTVSQQNKADNPQNPFPDPGRAEPGLGPLDLGGFLSALGVIFSGEFWLRVAEFLIGAVLVGVGVAHISPAAGATLRRIPVYGKAIR